MTNLSDLKEVPLSEIKPYSNNPRINEAAVSDIAESIEAFGFVVPILLDEKNTIIAGHTRWEAAKTLDLESAPCLYAKGLSDDQVKAFRIADNRLAENSSWNMDLLAEEMQGLEKSGFQLGVLGFSREELDCILEPVSADCLDDLNHESVCGDVEKVDPNSGQRTTVRISLGEFSWVIPLSQYNEWASNMRASYSSASDVVAHLQKILDLTPVHTSKEEETEPTSETDDKVGDGFDE